MSAGEAGGGRRGGGRAAVYARFPRGGLRRADGARPSAPCLCPLEHEGREPDLPAGERQATAA